MQLMGSLVCIFSRQRTQHPSVVGKVLVGRLMTIIQLTHQNFRGYILVKKPFCNLNGVGLNKTTSLVWAQGDSNPRPTGYEPVALTRLSYGPDRLSRYENMYKGFEKKR
jgi:hypothetical protein